MPRAIRIHGFGGPEVLRWEEVAVGDPGPGEARIKQTAVGLNYIDIYHRTGLYKLPLPTGLGSEAAGVVTAIGPDVTELKVGERVAYGSGPVGSYAEERVMPVRHLVPLPDAISDRQAAAMMLQGLTAHYLLRQTFKVEPGQTIVMVPAAGGVGLIVGQWARHLGARAIGGVGSADKADLARAHGYAEVIDYSREDMAARVKELTSGRGVPVVYDGVGRSTFDASLDCLAPRGLMALFGQASGPVPPFELQRLAQKGSLYITRPTLGSYVPTREELLGSAKALFDVAAQGAVRVDVRQTFPLAEAAEAHRALEGRKTTGSTVLVV